MMMPSVENEGEELVKFRYGIVEYSDMIRDLKYWETLLTSTFMQRPH
jgi:hypothetical protein